MVKKVYQIKLLLLAALFATTLAGCLGDPSDSAGEFWSSQSLEEKEKDSNRFVTSVTGKENRRLASELRNCMDGVYFKPENSGKKVNEVVAGCAKFLDIKPTAKGN